MIRFRAVFKIVGFLILVISVAMATGIPFSLYFKDGELVPFVISVGITAIVGSLMVWYKPPRDTLIGKREGYLVVAFGWVSMAFASTLPYILTGTTTSFVDAFFESVSGLTTTGATIFNDIEIISPSVLYWRSLTQWIGGMGIIVLTIAIFPLLGIGGVELFTAEAPGPTSDKIHPRIQVTAKRLWLIYVGLTSLLFFLLWASGMTPFDSVNHAFTCMATGGFSTKNASIAAFPAHFHYIFILFMFIAGTNFTVTYYMLTRKFKRVYNNEEFRFYLLMIAVFTSVFAFNIFFKAGINVGVEQAFRDGLFQVISLMTTTGYVTADYTSWTPGLQMLSFVLLFLGASAGSTAGGIKMVRNLVFIKHIWYEFKRMLHPRAFIRVKVNKKVVPETVIANILIFFTVYVLWFILGSIVITVFGMDFDSSLGAAATSLGNVGPGIGAVGPMNNFSEIPTAAKLFLPFLMLLGRLELFTILILFAPHFWKAN
jgi:trk system potassium uptake protein TrkH